MRVRPIFLLLLAIVCVGTLVFAATYRIQQSNVLKVHFMQEHLITSQPANLVVTLTDTQGMPIDSAHLSVNGSMTDMSMPKLQPVVRSIGPGKYSLVVSLSMAGSWQIDVSAQADGFLTSQRCFSVQVE